MKHLVVALLLVWCRGADCDEEKLPNIVFILTDDQDTELGGMVPMTKTKELIGKQGIVYENMFVSSPLCCPSRSSIFSGKYVHNHGALNNSLEGGCSDATWQQREEPNAFPALLKRAGYSNFFAGKYLNQYGFPKAGGVAHIPPGWDWWYGLVGNSKYYNYQVSVNGTMEKHGHVYAKDYFTNYINEKAMQFLETRKEGGGPFFMMMATPACHGPFTPADIYNNSFPNERAPRNGSYNVKPKDKHWLIQQTIVPLPSDTVTSDDNVFRNRWRTLLSVDDMVENVVNILQQKNLLEDTYIFFSSDNGFHLGQFGLPSDKRQLYEFDIRVPLMARGPGIKPGQVSKENVMNVDLGPTFIALSGQSVPQPVDGKPLQATWSARDPGQNEAADPFRSTVLVEHSGEHAVIVKGCPRYDGQGMANCNPHCVCEDSWNNTYNCMRTTLDQLVYKFCVIKETPEFVEMYNMTVDPYEFTNIANTADPTLVQSLRDDLDRLIRCSGSSCSNGGKNTQT